MAANQTDDHARSLAAEDEMTWVKAPGERPCDTCGTALEHWVLQRDRGHTVAELIFCPVCSPGVESMFRGSQKASGAV